MQKVPPIGPLTKITLILTSADGNPGLEPAKPEASFEFVYGIGTQGLSRFEKELHGLRPGAKINISLEAHEVQSYFEHLQRPLAEALNLQPPLRLTFEVQSIRPATDRELVHALADRNECGCDCGCDH